MIDGKAFQAEHSARMDSIRVNGRNPAKQMTIHRWHILCDVYDGKVYAFPNASSGSWSWLCRGRVDDTGRHRPITRDITDLVRLGYVVIHGLGSGKSRYAVNRPTVEVTESGIDLLAATTDPRVFATHRHRASSVRSAERDVLATTDDLDSDDPVNDPEIMSWSVEERERYAWTPEDSAFLTASLSMLDCHRIRYDHMSPLQEALPPIEIPRSVKLLQHLRGMDGETDQPKQRREVDITRDEFIEMCRLARVRRMSIEDMAMRIGTSVESVRWLAKKHKVPLCDLPRIRSTPNTGKVI